MPTLSNPGIRISDPVFVNVILPVLSIIIIADGIASKIYSILLDKSVLSSFFNGSFLLFVLIFSSNKIEDFMYNQNIVHEKKTNKGIR